MLSCHLFINQLDPETIKLVAYDKCEQFEKNYFERKFTISDLARSVRYE